MHFYETGNEWSANTPLLRHFINQQSNDFNIHRRATEDPRLDMIWLPWRDYANEVRGKRKRSIREDGRDKRRENERNVFESFLLRLLDHLIIKLYIASVKDISPLSHFRGRSTNSISSGSWIIRICRIESIECVG